MSRSGSTLLELTLVVSILGVLLALVGPRVVDARDRVAVQSASNELAAAFSMARRAAITEGTFVAIVFDRAAGAIEVRSRTDRILRRSLADAYGIVLGSNRDSAVYDPRGLGYGASNLSITVRRGSIVDTLTMSRLGRVNTGR